MIAALAVLISLAAFVVALFSLVVSEEKFRLDLYNKRFDIYVRTIRFYEVYHNPEDENFTPLHRDFVLASLESQFLFAPESGVYSLLNQLNLDSFTIKRWKDLPDNLSAEEQKRHLEQRSEAIRRWNVSMPPLESRMAEYLNFHHASASAKALSRLRQWLRPKKGSIPPSQ
jgi:hypothetical protein